MLKMEAMQCKIELENGLVMPNALEDRRPLKWEEETEEEKTKRVNIAIKATLKGTQ